MERLFRSKSEEQTAELGRRLGKELSSGAFVALYGDLGSGKTAFARGVGAALGIVKMTSPTFTIVREYGVAPRLYHFDAYRLSGEDELYAMGFEDYKDGIILMEWANLVAGALPEERLDICIEGSGDEERRISAAAHGAGYRQILERL
ncbi:MAG: tRNA (adenosine(37)-N6)-threonylcarbamoyltransferase complex ATPase subunit type 1 TsaE [Clostridia bacterium]|nr:tRNA (adenosine(37)-N6)-threonylcarbamoyltransferase complex ATPase subunit type 1 TsaE [Clostridia bacterium]